MKHSRRKPKRPGASSAITDDANPGRDALIAVACFIFAVVSAFGAQQALDPENYQLTHDHYGDYTDQADKDINMGIAGAIVAALAGGYFSFQALSKK